MFKKTLALGLVSALMLIGAAAQAAPINLLTNGSFESGLAGWTATGSQISFPPAAVTTDGSTACCFGEAVPADTVINGSIPDAAGTHGVYFVDDLANQTLSQSVFLAAGSYVVGFDAYAPLNGFSNAGDALFTGSIAGVLLANYSVHTQNNPGVWKHYQGIANVLFGGNYNVAFNFQTFGGASADVVIDRAYIITTEGGGTPIPPPTTGVPEPASLALLGLGLALLGMTRRRKAK